MPNYGFGHRNFGDSPFGGIDWCRVVLWEEMPENLRDQDEAAGSPYLKFIESMCPNFEWLRKYIQRFETITDPYKIRHDLLAYFAKNFGIDIDLAEPEAYQRTRASLAARWNIIKGTVESYKVLCLVHGFNVEVIPLLYVGVEYYSDEPHILYETPTYSRSESGGQTTYRIWIKASPSKPNTVEGSIGAVNFTEDGNGTISSVHSDFVSGTIDYGWGYIQIVLDGSHSSVPSVSYTSIIGGCPSVARKCKTNKLRLRITPGDIAGQGQLTISEAFQRLYIKLGVSTGDGVIPVHVELYQVEVTGETIVSIGYRYDVLPADDYTVDTGLRWEFIP